MRLCSRCLLLTSLVSVGATVAAEPATKEAEVNGITMSYVEEGSGEPIVFLHGSVSDSRAWEGVRAEIADDYRFIAPTYRYHGPGEWPEGDMTWGDRVFIDDIATFIEGLDVGPVHVVGWSMGSNLATVVALEHPELVQDLVLFEPALDTFLKEGAEGDAAREAAGQMFGPVMAALDEGDAEKATRALIEGVFQMEPGGFDSQPEALKEMQLDNARTLPPAWSSEAVAVTCDMLGQLDKPVLIVHGGDSNAFWVQIAEGMAECLPQAEVAVLPGTNHGGPVQDPAGLAAMIEEFVASH